ncbi:Possible Transcriptional Regulator, Crp/Fnr family [Trichormus variabilis ATCC 29413]|uniref:Possible Transcriptional Regulator, Crp/Fnr family n=2 Tax=Anabaena variabilis TaxID=264691 RepID=Q3MFZ7_TRIV2|nr:MULTISPECIES: Crp/Fnr family transcriptional regulator [Nostocaceae]ABA20089.1 Possible Transcriptional Regulator, Crp/Fnr family [Trichormus variabilis ATCC 29413]MBC1214695.1 Crp/Fnr family transcriptional regulator [Trichormus variabilis ARAD]MBC1255382.1 Crp/Fnr family transcriptional regulator [Trichormus variabilis V5]MBC1268662.1 Crp/Fnr family transcriptional regulator [Trichormus variabilis FSR]MBC1303615.1 Crp/Fnr family transcriptional regulator [Trichormus variabilis N2B]
MAVTLYSSIATPHNKNTHHYFTRRTFLPDQQNSLWKIEAGFVRTFTYLENGTTVALGLWGPGDILGRALSKLEPYQMECLTKVEATIVPIEEWKNPTDTLLAHIQQAEELMVIRSYKKVDTMLIKLLAWLSKKFGSEVDKGRLIDMRLTHEDLAEMLGSTRVTITRILGQFEEEGLINRLSLHRIVLKEEDIWYYEI